MEDCDGFLCMFKAISDAGAAAPRVFSFSFGDPETQRSDELPLTNKEFMKLTATGITLIGASGDCGACADRETGEHEALGMCICFR